MEGDWVGEGGGWADGQVTVFGQSAGAISISLLMLNEDIDLFRGAVSPPHPPLYH